MLAETRQLLRLRTLRVQRARDVCSQAQAHAETAVRQVEQRQREVESAQRAMEALQHSLVHGLAPRLPRWIDVAAAQRERLADRLERAEYHLVEDEHALEQARERVQQARAQLTRALAREDAVRGLAGEAQRAVLLAREQKLERESDDQLLRRAR
jgi:flagellar biosynthesis chaperone FliJ